MLIPEIETDVFETKLTTSSSVRDLNPGSLGTELSSTGNRSVLGPKVRTSVAVTGRRGRYYSIKRLTIPTKMKLQISVSLKSDYPPAISGTGDSLVHQLLAVRHRPASFLVGAGDRISRDSTIARRENTERR